MLVSVVFGIVALVWGFANGSQVVLLDGIYVLLGLALSALSLYASAVVSGGPTRAFPFGREPLIPLVVGIQGAALIGTFVYAAVEAVRVIAAGGGEVSAASLAVYGLVSTVVTVVTWAVLRKAGKDSDLVRAEAASWLAGAVGSVAIIVGSAAALLLERAGVVGAARYADSVLVIATSILLLPLPVRMLRQSVRELLGAAPEPALGARVRDAVERIRTREHLPEPVLRVRKVARVLHVEVGFIVPAGTRSVEDEDRVRRAVHDALDDLDDVDTWIVVEISADPDLLL